MHPRTCYQLLIGTLFSFLIAQMPSEAATASAVNGPTLIAGIASAFSSGQPINSVQLSGKVQRAAGSTSDSGPITLTANADGSAQLRFDFSGGSLSETQTATGGARDCQWTGPDSVTHDSSGSNCWPSLTWFLPQVMLQPGTVSSHLSTTYLGVQPTAAGSLHALESQMVVASATQDAKVAAQIQGQSMAILYVDPATLLPSILDYSVLTDSGSAMIAVEVRFSNYQKLAGLTVPGHIERYLNGSLDLSIDVTQASVLN